MLAGAAQGSCRIERPLRGEDCLSTLACLQAMGVSAQWEGDALIVEPPIEWSLPAAALDCGNSGTTIRLLSGLIASRPIEATLVGDASLSRRPMRRIAEPLRLMGATVEGETPPLRVKGGSLRGIDYRSPVASAQVKSCILLAGLRAEGPTSVTEPHLSRDHTERMLKALAVPVRQHIGPQGATSRLESRAELPGFRLSVPADISSAAFWAVAAALLPGSEVTLSEVGVNPTRTGLLDVMRQCGIRFEAAERTQELGEPVADLTFWGGAGYRPYDIDGTLVPRLIDEIPVLAVLATQCEGVSRIRGAAELRVKESDRIETVACGLRAMGASVETKPDGMDVEGPTRLKGASIDAMGDHRIAMAFAVAGLIAKGETELQGWEAVATSYPQFEVDLASLAVY